MVKIRIESGVALSFFSGLLNARSGLILVTISRQFM